MTILLPVVLRLQNASGFIPGKTFKITVVVNIYRLLRHGRCDQTVLV
jgi:hypothetical protein